MLSEICIIWYWCYSSQKAHLWHILFSAPLHPKGLYQRSIAMASEKVHLWMQRLRQGNCSIKAEPVGWHKSLIPVQECCQPAISLKMHTGLPAPILGLRPVRLRGPGWLAWRNGEGEGRLVGGLDQGGVCDWPEWLRLVPNPWTWPGQLYPCCLDLHQQLHWSKSKEPFQDGCNTT